MAVLRFLAGAIVDKGEAEGAGVRVRLHWGKLDMGELGAELCWRQDYSVQRCLKLTDAAAW